MLLRVAVITPKVAEPTVLPGWAKFGWLKRLKNSERNWTVNRSLIFMFLIREKSKLLKPGPTVPLRPKLPKTEVPHPGCSTGMQNAAVLNQSDGSRWATANGPIWFGRRVASPVALVAEIFRDYQVDARPPDLLRFCRC